VSHFRRHLDARLITAVALVLVAVAAFGSGSTPAAGKSGINDIAWTVQSSPFALDAVKGGKSLVADATGPAGPGSRLSYSLADGSYHTLKSVVGSHAVAHGTQYLISTDEPGRMSTVTVTTIAGGLHVSWRLLPATGVATVYSAMRSPAPREHFVGGGIDHAGVDLDGHLVQVKVAYSCARSVVTPFFASSAGYGMYFDTDSVGQMEFDGDHDGMSCDDSNSGHPLCKAVSAPDRVQVCFKASSLDYDVFAGTPTKVVAAYRVAAGRIPVPSPAEFGAIKWRDRVSGSAEILDDVAQFRRLRIPLGSVLLDNPWEKDGCWGALQFDPTRFAQPAALIRRIHRSGVKFLVWVSPWVTASTACRAVSDFGVGSTFPTPQGWNAIDFTSAAARATFEQKIARLVRLGVDGFKGDRGDETDLESIPFANGDGTEIHNLYPELFARSVLAGARKAGERSPVTMFRAGWTSTATVGAGIWAGDQTPDFGGMQDAIHSLLSLGASGFAVTGSDIGGYGAGTGRNVLTREVFERWTQLGAISPILELGGADRAATFWKFGPQATAVARNSIRLHYDLFPYLYSLARDAARHGSPILQPLGLVYPDDERAWKSNLELLVGRNLLAAPVTSPTRTPSVYLPAGRWHDLFTGRELDGGRVVRRATPLDQFPLYLRVGTTIPFNLRSAQLWHRAWPLNALQLPGRAGWLAGGSTIDLRGAPPESEVLFPSDTPPHSVTVDGRKLQRFASASAMQAVAAGWTWNTAPFPGVLVKVRPRAGRAHISVSSRH
jgi:alpha-D-xyloside xylohydrolase